MTGNNPFARSGLLRGLAEELDPTPDQKRRAADRYEDLGAWLQDHAGDTRADGIEVYPQGSGNLGTTNRDPFTGEFDIDLVIRAGYRKGDISQEELNREVNGWLGSYVSARQRDPSYLAPTKLERGKRAWTFEYDDEFHMDVLPVVPDLDGQLDHRVGDPSWLTDKSLTRWQPTNPRGFAELFRAASVAERQRILERFEKRADVDVEDLPADEVKTSLQLAVQLLKRHRDNMFRGDSSGVAPPSAVITALALAAYEEVAPAFDDLGDVLEAIVGDMPNHIGRRSGELWIPNPSCLEENYADRYVGRSDKKNALRNWLGRAQEDFGRVTTARSMQEVSKAVDESFGEGLGPRIAKRVGDETQRLRSSGTLGSTATGALTAGSGDTHQEHRFYGQPAS